MSIALITYPITKKMNFFGPSVLLEIVFSCLCTKYMYSHCDANVSPILFLIRLPTHIYPPTLSFYSNVLLMALLLGTYVFLRIMNHGRGWQTGSFCIQNLIGWLKTRWQARRIIFLVLYRTKPKVNLEFSLDHPPTCTWAFFSG